MELSNGFMDLLVAWVALPAQFVFVAGIVFAIGACVYMFARDLKDVE